MTTQEFSNEFDVLYNNIMSNQAPGLNEYEKSVFLTKAQYEIVKNYCNPKGNKYQEGVDGSPKRQIDFSTLLRVEPKTPIDNIDNINKFDDRSIVFEYPSNAWIPINETLNVNDKSYQIVPLAYNEYLKLMSKPYKYPLKNQAWRLFNRSGGIHTTGINSRSVRYDDDTITLRSLNNTDKDITIILKESSTVNPENNPPVIVQSAFTTQITITLPVNIPSSVWFNNYLFAPNSPTYAREFVEMTGPWDDREGHSSFPSFVPSKGNIEDYTIMELVIPAKKNIPSATVSEVIGNFDKNNSVYKVRYFKKPTPIILTDLSDDDLNIDGVSEISECILPEELHPEILQRAVELAKAAFQGDLNSTIELGKRSE